MSTGLKTCQIITMSKTQAELLRIKYAIDLLEEIARPRPSMAKMMELVPKADLAIMDKDGNSALNLIMPWGKQDLMRLMIENGADINHRGAQGKTPLHDAMDRHSYKSIDLLLEMGADIHIKDDNGQSPVEFVRACGANELADKVTETFNTLSAHRKEAAVLKAAISEGMPVQESFPPMKPIKIRQGF
jgi:ankyrin repeat protein